MIPTIIELLYETLGEIFKKKKNLEELLKTILEETAIGAFLEVILNLFQWK